MPNYNGSEIVTEIEYPYINSLPTTHSYNIYGILAGAQIDI